jgi:outer membrane protein TolC
MAIAALNKDKAAYTKAAYRANYFPKISASGNYLFSDMSLKAGLPKAYLPTFAPDPSGALVPNVVTGPDGNPVTGADGNPVFKEYAYFPGADFSLKMNNLFMAGIYAEQPIYAGGKIKAAYNMARIGDEIAGLGSELARAEVIVKADEAYWTYVQAREMLGLALSYRETLDELLRNVEAAVATGLRHRNDALKVQVKFNEAELQLRRAENGARLALKNLCYVTGLPSGSEPLIPASFDDEALPSPLPEGAYSDRPEYAMLREQVRLKEEEVKLVRADFLPKVGIMANYGYVNGLTLNNGKLLDKASFAALASVGIPLFQWGEGRNKVRAAKAERAAALLQQEDAGEQMALELARASDRCDESAMEVELTARSLEQADENMNVSRLQYEGGMETLSGYLEAQTARRQAQSEHVDALTRQRLNRTYYLKAAGRL